MLLKPSSLRKTFLYFIQGPKFYGGGSPPATPTQTTQTVNQNSIPAELLPYVKNMLNKAEPLTQEAYKPYSTNAADYVAPFSPLQLQAQQGAANLQTPGQFAPASQMAGLSGLGSMTAGQNYQNQATDPNAVGAYMNPYLQQSLAPQLQLLNQQFGIQQAEQQGKATQAGAFGGSREALQSGLINQNQGLAQQKMISEGYNQAFNQAQNAQQFGANLGLQGMGQGIQAAGQLGALGTQQLGAQTSVLGTQSQIGGQQQAQQQQAINQAVLNYQNAQQYPYMQLGFMSDLLRGTPTGNVTQTQYQAQPGMASQLGGLAATGLGAYAAMKADGGVIEDKGYAKGGIVGFKDRGYVEESMLSKLEDLDRPRLAGIIQKNESPELTGLAKEVYATKLAKGGIVAFAEGEVVGGVKPLTTRHKKMLDKKEQADKVANKTDMGIGARSPLFAVDEEFIPSPAASTLAVPRTAQTPTIAEEAVVSPTGITGVAEVPVQTQPAATMPPAEYMTQLQKDMAASETEAAIPLETRVEDLKKEREALVGKDTATEDFRAQLTQERANAPDEARRQMGMRLMEFGANWASTPGAPLVAGMKAMRETLPNVMEDTKANKKAMKDLDASIYALEHATRLEELGLIDKATDAKDKAQTLFLKHKDTWINAGLAKEKLEQEASIADKKMANDIKTAQIAASRAGRDVSQITGSTMALIKQKSHEDAVKEAEDVDAYTDKEGKAISKKDWVDNREMELSRRYLTAGVEQPESTGGATKVIGSVTYKQDSNGDWYAL